MVDVQPKTITLPDQELLRRNLVLCLKCEFETNDKLRTKLKRMSLVMVLFDSCKYCEAALSAALLVLVFNEYFNKDESETQVFKIKILYF